jgi:hypothetical protein
VTGERLDRNPWDTVCSSLEKIIESKRALRRELAQRPIGEKLRMLDALRERQASPSAGVPSTRPTSS